MVIKFFCQFSIIVATACHCQVVTYKLLCSTFVKTAAISPPSALKRLYQLVHVIVRSVFFSKLLSN